MKTVKVTVKREQVLGHIKIWYPYLGEPPQIIMPENFTLELPVEQVELGPALLTPKPNPLTCVHEFDEIELGGMGKIKLCRLCGTAREVKQEVKQNLLVLKLDEKIFRAVRDEIVKQGFSLAQEANLLSLEIEHCGIILSPENYLIFEKREGKQEVKEESKRKRYKLLKVDRVGPRYNEIEHGTVIELEEVE